MLTLTAISASTSSRRSGPLCMRYCTKMLTIVSLNMKLLRCGPFFSPSSPCWVSSWFYLIKHRFYMKWIEPFQVNRTMKVLWTPTPQNCGQIRWLQNTLIYYKLDLQIGFRNIDTVSHFGLFTGSVQKVLAREVWKRPESCWGVAPATFRKNWNHLVEKTLKTVNFLSEIECKQSESQKSEPRIIEVHTYVHLKLVWRSNNLSLRPHSLFNMCWPFKNKLVYGRFN